MGSVNIQDRLDGSYAVVEAGKPEPLATAPTREEAIRKAAELIPEVTAQGGISAGAAPKA